MPAENRNCRALRRFLFSRHRPQTPCFQSSPLPIAPNTGHLHILRIKTYVSTSSTMYCRYRRSSKRTSVRLDLPATTPHACSTVPRRHRFLGHERRLRLQELAMRGSERSCSWYITRSAIYYRYYILRTWYVTVGPLYIDKPCACTNVCAILCPC